MNATTATKATALAPSTDWLRQSDLAKVFPILSPPGWRNVVASRAFPVRRIGRAVLLRRADVERYLEALPDTAEASA